MICYLSCEESITQEMPPVKRDLLLFYSFVPKSTNQALAYRRLIQNLIMALHLLTIHKNVGKNDEEGEDSHPGKSEVLNGRFWIMQDDGKGNEEEDHPED